MSSEERWEVTSEKFLGFESARPDAGKKKNIAAQIEKHRIPAFFMKSTQQNLG